MKQRAGSELCVCGAFTVCRSAKTVACIRRSARLILNTLLLVFEGAGLSQSCLKSSNLIRNRFCCCGMRISVRL